MARKTKKRKPALTRNDITPERTFKLGRRTVRFIADKVIIFRLMRQLHGRFWGLAGLLIMIMLFSVCFAIRPDMLDWSTAFSDFGRDVKTAPYLAAALFFGAYGLWRWRNYLRRTLRHARPLTGLVGLTVAGLYIAALFPVAWGSWPYNVHIFGVILFGVSMAVTVVVDTLLTRTRRGRTSARWRLVRLSSFLLIITGGYITLGSVTAIGWFRLALLGELLMMLGYALWIIDKTVRGEGVRSQLSNILHKLVLVD